MAKQRDPQSKAGRIRTFFEKNGLETPSRTVRAALETFGVKPTDITAVRNQMQKEMRENGHVQTANIDRLQTAPVPETAPAAAPVSPETQRICLEQTLLEDLRAVKQISKKVGGYTRLRQLIGILE